MHDKWSSSLGGSLVSRGRDNLCLASCSCFDHIALIATLCAGARIDILEALKLKELTLFASNLSLNLAFHGSIGVHLSVR